MAVRGHEPVAPREQLSDARQTHAPGHESVKRVALNSHEFGKALGPAKSATLGDEVDLR